MPLDYDNNERRQTLTQLNFVQLFKLASGAKVCAGAHFDLPDPRSRIGANFRVNNGNNMAVYSHGESER